MRVAAERYSAIAWARRHLQGIILAYFTLTRRFGPDLNDLLYTPDIHSFLHRDVDEARPLYPITLLAGAIHTNEKTPGGFFKASVFQQVFYDAFFAKQFPSWPLENPQIRGEDPLHKIRPPRKVCLGLPIEFREKRY